MTFQREKQNVSASDLLQALADLQDIQLNQCTITGTLDINRLFQAEEKFNTEKISLKQDDQTRTLNFPQSIVFDKCIFEENVVFAGPWNEPDSICVIFETDVVFNSSVFKAQCRFRNSVFEKNAGFDGCTFNGIATFKNAKFQGEAKLRTTIFDGYALFGNAVFNQSGRFTNTHFVKGANFSQAQFLGPSDFNGVYSSSRAVPASEGIVFKEKKQGHDESFWRFVKQTALEAGYYQLAGECFYKERCARLYAKLTADLTQKKFSIPNFVKKTLRLLKLLPEIILGKMLFGYGERPVRVLIASFIIIVFCACLYSQPNALVDRSGHPVESDFFQSLYFSTITFTTLGYGDLCPVANTGFRMLAMAQAVTGACLIALFVVCLAKRFSRG